jgi:hypothetical protein
VKTCIFCGEPIDSEDEDPNEIAHVWCANGEEPPDTPPALDEIFKLDNSKKS